MLADTGGAGADHRSALARAPAAVRAAVILLDAGRPDEATAGRSATATGWSLPSNLAYVDLHLGLDRPAQGRWRSRTAAPWRLVSLGAGEPIRPRTLRGVLASTSICFDISVFELFVPLAGGGTVILADERPGAARAAGGRAR